MSRSLSIHQITAMAAGPNGLVRIAAENGCDGVCVFTHIPAQLADRGFPRVDQSNKAEMLAAMTEYGVGVSNVEYCPIMEGTDVAGFEAGLVIGAELGAARAVCHVFDTDGPRAVDRLGALSELAEKLGLSLGLEFMPLTAGCATMQRAAWFVDQVARSNLAIAVDMLHLVRSGGTAAEVAALDPHYFAYAQICDGKGLHTLDSYWDEALDREPPGEGDFPILDILNALPSSCALDVEVPTAKPVDAAAWAKEAVERSRALIKRAVPRP